MDDLELIREIRRKHIEDKIIDLKENFDDNDFALIEKLGIKVKDEIYSACDFDVLQMKIVDFYTGADMEDEINEIAKELPSDVDREEYNKLVKKVFDIKDKYNI